MFLKVAKHRDHHGRGGGVADPHGEEGGGQHEPEHQVGWTRSLAVRKFSTVTSFKYVSLPQKKTWQQNKGCEQFSDIFTARLSALRAILL